MILNHLPPHTAPILSLFFVQLESIPLLTKDEEFELGVAAQRWLPIERIRKEFEDEFARQPTAEVQLPLPHTCTVKMTSAGGSSFLSCVARRVAAVRASFSALHQTRAVT